jgi:ABC-type transporter lipoprotein component MlaA
MNRKDKYTFMRDSFLQRRQSLVNDANPATVTTPDAAP